MEGMMVDLGGIGKGAVSDTVVQIFKKFGIKTALFSLGGNIGAMGKKRRLRAIQDRHTRPRDGTQKRYGGLYHNDGRLCNHLQR